MVDANIAVRRFFNKEKVSVPWKPMKKAKHNVTKLVLHRRTKIKGFFSVDNPELSISKKIEKLSF